MKNILFIFTKAPYQSFLCQEFLDTVFFAASYGLKVSVFFTALGVEQLFQSDTDKLPVKNISKQISAFRHFDITEIYVAANIERTERAFVIPAKQIRSEAKLKEQFDYVIYDELPCQS
jgi:sulfur relay (sulfurtransferase) DsrF/TusC family protein